MALKPNNLYLTGIFGEYYWKGLADRYRETGRFPYPLLSPYNGFTFTDEIYAWARKNDHSLLNYSDLRQAIKPRKQNGHIVTGAISPYYLDNANIKQMLRNLNVPEETAWFYVESVTVDLNDYRPNFVSGNGIDDVTSAPLAVIAAQNVNPFGNGFKVKGIRGDISPETYDTEINGKTYTRNKVNLRAFPLSDEWLKQFGVVRSESVNSSMMDFYGLQFGYISYYSTTLDGFGTSADYHFPARHDPKLTNKYSQVFKRNLNQLTINWSFHKMDITQRVNLIDSYTSEISTVQDVTRRYNIQGDAPDLALADLSYPGNNNTRGIGLRVLERSSPGLNKNRFMLPNFNYPLASQEDAEYKNQNQNIVSAINRSRLLSELVNAAGLLSPFTFHATLMRLISNLGNIYMSYLNEQAREADALANYNAGDVINAEGRTNPNLTIFELETQERQTITVPTKKIFYNRHHEPVINRDNNAMLTLDINRLFKSVEDYEAYLYNNYPTVYATNHSQKIRPYMINDEYEQPFEIWSRKVSKWGASGLD